MKHVLISSAFGILLLSSCGTMHKGQRKHQTIDTVTVQKNNPLDLFRATAPLQWRIQNTRVALSFDYAARTAKGQEWVSMQPYFYATDSVWLDAKGMKIESVTGGIQDKALNYRYEDDKLKISLDKMYRREETLKLNIRYTTMPYLTATGGSDAISDDRGLYFINTDHKIPGKPVQIWTQGETEANSHWLPTIDKPNSRTTVQLELTVPDSFKTLANGAMVTSTVKGNLRTDVWKMDQPIQVYAIMFAIGDFAIVKDKWKNKEVNYYVEPAYAPYARKMFKHTPEMIGYFSDITGVSYPWNKYHQVVVRDYVSGAMENTSASLFGEFMNENNRELADKDFEDVVSHELFHQWFGDYATAESWSNLTVNESFANYGEQLWRRYKYGSAYADQLANEDLQKYLASTTRKDPVLVRFHYRDKEEMFDRVSYQKGGAILRYLHALAGDTAFYKAMNLYLTHNALKSAEATHWRLAVEEATGQDWNWFFNQWYHRAGHPILDINYHYDDQAQLLKVVVSQKQEQLYELPMQCKLLYGDKAEMQSWHLTAATDTFTYAYHNGVAPVLIPDAAHVVPAVFTENKTYKQWLEQLKYGADFISKLNAVDAVKDKDLGDATVQSLLRKALTDPDAFIRREAIAQIMNTEKDQQQQNWKNDVVMMAMSDGNNTDRSLALYTLGKWKMNDQRELMLESLHDSSYAVAACALYALSRIAPDTAYVLAKQFINDKPGTRLDQQAWSVIGEKAMSADTALLRRFAFSNKYGMQEYLMIYIADFAANTRDEAAYRRMLDLLASMIIKVEQKNHRADYVTLFNYIYETVGEKTKGKDRKKDPLYQVKLDQLDMTVKQLRAAETEKNVQEVYDTYKTGRNN